MNIPKLKISKGARFTSFLFIAASILIAAGIIWGADMYYDIDAGKVIVNETQRIVKSGSQYALEIIGKAKLGGSSDYAKFSSTGDLTFVGAADTISKTDAALTIQTDSHNLTIETATSGVLAITSAGALNLTGATSSSIDFPNFDVASTGHITVQPGYGLDTNAAGILNLGNTTSTTINIGNSAATTIALGAGGSLARTINIGTGTGVDTINIGTGGTSADVIRIGDSVADLALTDAQWSITTAGLITTADDLAVNGGDITTSAGTFNLLNTNAATINFGGAATAINFGSSAGTTTLTSGDALTIKFSTSTGGFILESASPSVKYLEIGTDGKLSVRSGGSGDILLDPASGTIYLGSGDVIKTSTGGAASRASGDLIFREMVPIFGFDLPAQTASTSYVKVSKVLENYPFPAAISGTTRVHKLVFRYAASTTAPIDWRISTTTGATYSSSTLPIPGSIDLTKGNAYVTTTTIPTDGTDWWIDVKTPDASSTVRIFQIFLAAYDQVQ